MSIILGIIVAVLIVFLFFQVFKIPKIGTLVMVTGGVKTGKSLMSVWFVYRKYKRAYLFYKIKSFFAKILRLKPIEEPLIYSNVPLGVPYVQLTEDLLLRKKRFNYKSIIYCCEASLIADSQYFRDMDTNERLLLFNKLIGHETRGGTLIYDTQCINDMHYSIKRSISQYFYIHRLRRWFPFFCIAYVKEYLYSDDKSTINVETQDIEESMKRVIIPKSVYKLYDCYCYSAMTDNLSVDNRLRIAPKINYFRKDLKSKHIVSFKKFIKNKEYLSNEKKDNT